MNDQLSLFDAPTVVTDKVTYVLNQKQSRHHECHWPGCRTQCPPAMWGCREHWYKIPASLRRRVWAAYEPGQEKTMTPSEDYVQVAREVQEWIEKYGVKKFEVKL